MTHHIILGSHMEDAHLTLKSPCHKSTASGVIVAKAGAYASS